MNAFIKKYWHNLVLGVFMIIHALTCIFTNYYGDDYYYANFVRRGTDYFVSENIFHYKYTNGRALVHLLDELLLGWSFWLWRIFNIALLALLVIVIAKIAARAYRGDIRERFAEYQRAMAVTCAIFAVTDVAVLRQSVYWATGAMNYLLPVTVTLWFYYIYRRDFENFRGSWLLLIPAFFASATTEQASAAALLVTLCFIVSSFVVKKKAPRPAYIGTLIASAAGFCTLYLSPGNAARTEYYPDFYALSLFGKIKHNFTELSTVIFGRGGIYTIVCIAFAVIIYICLTRYLTSDSRVKRTLALLLSGETALTLGLYVWGIVTGNPVMRQSWMIVMFAIPILSAMIWTAVRYFTCGDIDELYFVWCAVAMQIAMSLAPEYGPRTLLISLVCLAVPVVRILANSQSVGLYAAIAVILFALLPWYMSSPLGFVLTFAVAAVLAAAMIRKVGKLTEIPALVGCTLLALSLAQFSTVAIGYHGNVAVHELNRKQIEEYQQSDRSGALVLYYLPNVEYKYTMPYDDMYHQRVLLILSGIDPETQVYYEFLQ
ncbi:MAG: hypothetical protein HFE63_10990 [Clostridiales bacterium]|nr:hypothetical protein [Clostridiales bacterium]